jgi:hypothetical protein
MPPDDSEVIDGLKQLEKQDILKELDQRCAVEPARNHLKELAWLAGTFDHDRDQGCGHQ